MHMNKMSVGSGTTTVFLRDPNHSRSYVNFIRGIGEAKTKHEEDRIVNAEAEYLKTKMALPELNAKERRECLIRMVYCEMLGHNMSHCYIHAVKFLQSNNIMDKRVGYLTVSLLLHENHELIMLLINTIQKDLRSSNPLEVAMALTLICRLIGPEMIPPLLPSVQEKLMHPKEMVRRKAVMAMHHFYLRSPSSVAHLDEDFRRMLGDTDPGVMEGTLILFYQLVKDQPAKYKSMVPTFVNLLQSAIGRRLPKEMEYHGVPAPWVQIRLLKILAILGADDPRTSEHIYGVLTEVMSCAECNSSIGQGIMYEVIRAATLINFNSTLIDRAASNISRFLTSANNDWKYCGITALAMVTQVKPEVAQQYQMIVIDCLDDPDETLKKKTLDLLFQMTNPANVDIITERMLSFLRATHEDFIKRDLVVKITQIAERFSPNNLWFLKTMNEVFEVGGALVRKDVAHNLMRLIAEEDDDLDTELRRDAVSSYLELMRRPRLAEILVCQICWVVGEYSYVLEEEEDQEDVLERLTGLMGCRHEHQETNGWVVTALSKIIARLGRFPDSVLNHIATYLVNPNPDIQQRCIELCELSQNFETMQEVLPTDASCEDLEVDASLSFLDGFVAEALQNGAQPYRPAHMRENLGGKGRKGHDQLSTDAIKFEPYAPPPPRNVGSIVPTDSVSSSLPTNLPVVTETEETTPPEGGPDASMEVDVMQRTGIEVKKSVWGRGGLLRKGRGPNPMSLTPVGLDHAPQSNLGLNDTSSTGSETNTNIGSESGSLDASTALSSAQASIHQPSPEEQKKKELASALFGGLGGSGRTGPLSGPARPPKSKRKTTAATSTLTTPTAASQGSSPSNSPNLQKKTEVKKEDNMDLLLDLNFTGGGSVQENTTNGSAPLAPLLQESPAALGQGGQEATDSLFAGLHNASSGQTVDPIPSASLLSGLTGSLERPTVGLSATNVLEGLTPGIKLPAELEACPHTPFTEITQDGAVRVSITKVYQPGQLSVVFYLTSMRQTPQDLVVSFMLPSSCQCSLNGASVPSSTSTDVTLAPFGTCQKVVGLVALQPALQMTIRCELSYRQEGRKQFCDQPLHISDMLRPWEIVTKEFGQKWGSLSHERRQKVPCTVKTPQEFHTICKEQLHFHPVEIIRKEAIAAATFIPSTPVLIHGKTLGTPGMMEVWIKSTNGMLTEAVEKQLVAVLKK